MPVRNISKEWILFFWLHQPYLQVIIGFVFCIFIIGSQPSALATDVAHLLGCEAVSVRKKTFDDGEKRLQLPISVAGKEVIIFQTITDQPDAVIFETLRIIDAAKTAGAKAITVVFPCYPYARQDRIVQDGCGLPAQLIAKLLKTAGADRLVTVDMHAPKQIEQFPLPTFNLSTEALFADYLRQEKIQTDESLLFAPDRGALTRVQTLAKMLSLDFGWADKQRLEDGTIRLSDLHGNVRGKSVYLIDDRIDTGGTLIAVATRLKRTGAQRMIGIVTHGITSLALLEHLKTAGLDGLVETDTRNVTRDENFVEVLSVAELLTEKLRNLDKVCCSNKNSI